MSAAPPNVLLIESNALLRQTVALTARTLNAAIIDEAPSIQRGLHLLGLRKFQGLIVGFLEQEAGVSEALELIDAVRAGHTHSDADVPICVLVHECDAKLLSAFIHRGIKRVLIKPARARNLIDALVTIQEDRDLQGRVTL